MPETVRPPVGHSVYTIPVPHGGTARIPLAVDLSNDPYLRLSDSEACRRYYEEHGYVVYRGLVPAPLCDTARAAFEREVKPYAGFLYRQASAYPERHVFTEHGHMLNSLLNIQDFDARLFPNFRRAGMEVITSQRMQDAVRALLVEPGKVVQSMYFEGNPETWAHQDTYYLDGDPLGSMTAAWVALEDIHPAAGRFYVYPRSHRIDMAKNGGDFDIAFNHARYKALVIDVVKKYGLPCHAPALNKGDVLFWAAKTIHGSLPTMEPNCSRSSITAHFIRHTSRFMQYQTRPRRLHLETINGMAVHCPKNLNHWPNRLNLVVETRIPRVFQFVKRVAVKLVTSR